MPAAATYTIAPAPKFAGMRDWDCARCGRTEVRPVFLAGAGTVAPYGSGCAALLLGRPAGAARKIVNEAAAVQRAADAAAAQAADLAAAATRALAAWDAGDDTDADLERLRLNFATARRFGRLADDVRMAGYIAAVAATGNVYPATIAA